MKHAGEQPEKNKNKKEKITSHILKKSNTIMICVSVRKLLCYIL